MLRARVSVHGVIRRWTNHSGAPGDIVNEIRLQSMHSFKMTPFSRVLSRIHVHGQQPVIHHLSISCIFQGRSQLHPVFLLVLLALVVIVGSCIVQR